MNRFRASLPRSTTAFGRRAAAVAFPVPAEANLIDDLRLFATFFLGGFVFMAVYLA